MLGHLGCLGGPWFPVHHKYRHPKLLQFLLEPEGSVDVTSSIRVAGSPKKKQNTMGSCTNQSIKGRGEDVARLDVLSTTKTLEEGALPPSVGPKRPFWFQGPFYGGHQKSWFVGYLCLFYHIILDRTRVITITTILYHTISISGSLILYNIPDSN